MTFENLYHNVCDAVIDWENPFDWTIEQILAMLANGRLNKADYKVQFHVVGSQTWTSVDIQAAKYRSPILGPF
jgi:hypothetical protein